MSLRPIYAPLAFLILLKDAVVCVEVLLSLQFRLQFFPRTQFYALVVQPSFSLLLLFHNQCETCQCL